MLEILTSLRRAGADTIITYHAKDAARAGRVADRGWTARTATPKIRSRKDGAAMPLDELDRGC